MTNNTNVNTGQGSQPVYEHDEGLGKDLSTYDLRALRWNDRT